MSLPPPPNDRTKPTWENVILVVSDGTTPKTGAVLATVFGCKGWDVISLDPILQHSPPNSYVHPEPNSSYSACLFTPKPYSGIEHLYTVNAKIEEVVVRFGNQVVVVMMHAHTTFKDVGNALRHVGGEKDGRVKGVVR